MVWLIIIGFIVVGLLIGYFNSNEGEKADGSIGGALAGAGCAGELLFHIFIAGISIIGILWLFGAIFGGCS